MTLYVPAAFGSIGRAAAGRLMHDYPFATLITSGQAEPMITHLPLLHVADCEPHGSLLGHFARANPHARMGAEWPTLAVFQGPHAYVSPAWYANPEESVPTWNYAVVHAHGNVELAQNPVQTQAILDLMVQRFETQRERPWPFAMEGSRLAALIDAIVGFRLRIKRIDGKFKLSQNRRHEDRRGVMAALCAEGGAEGVTTAAWMEAYANPLGTPR